MLPSPLTPPLPITPILPIASAPYCTTLITLFQSFNLLLNCIWVIRIEVSLYFALFIIKNHFNKRHRAQMIYLKPQVISRRTRIWNQRGWIQRLCSLLWSYAASLIFILLVNHNQYNVLSLLTVETDAHLSPHVR